MRVHVFIPCLVDQFRPSAARSTLRVLESLGIEVDYTPEQVCCGQPFFKAGYHTEARRLALKTLLHFQDGCLVVSPSGSCVRMVREHYAEILNRDADEKRRALDLAGRTYELSEFLVRVLDVTHLGSSFSGRVTVHDSCQVRRGLGIWKEPRALLDEVAGLERIEMERSDTCCGFGGIFSARNPEISAALARDKISQAVATGAEFVTGCEISCLLHIERHARDMGVPIRTLHLAEILASGL